MSTPTSPLEVAVALAPVSPTTAAPSALGVTAGKVYVRQELPAAFAPANSLPSGATSPTAVSPTTLVSPLSALGLASSAAIPAAAGAPTTARPTLATRGISFADEAAGERNRRVSYAGQSLGLGAGGDAVKDDIWGAKTRTLRAGSDGAVLGVLAREREAREHEAEGIAEEDAEDVYEQGLFPEHRSSNGFAPSGLPLNSLGHSMALLSPGGTPTDVSLQQQQQQGPDGADSRNGASLHLGDLDVWMDEAYVKECCARMGWEGVTHIKMIRGTR